LGANPSLRHAYQIFKGEAEFHFIKCLTEEFTSLLRHVETPNLCGWPIHVKTITDIIFIFRDPKGPIIRSVAISMVKQPLFRVINSI